MKKYIALLAVAGLFFASCSDDDENIIPDGPDPTQPIEYTSGTADFSRYVAVGNSLTAGLSDAALFIEGQTASYPNMLAKCVNYASMSYGCLPTKKPIETAAADAR